MVRVFLFALLLPQVVFSFTLKVSPEYFGVILPPDTTMSYTAYVVDKSGQCISDLAAPENCTWQAYTDVQWIVLDDVWGDIPGKLTFTIDTKDFGEEETLKGYIYVVAGGEEEERIPIYLKVKSTPSEEPPENAIPVEGPFKFIEISDAETLSLALLYNMYTPQDVFVTLTSDLVPNATYCYKGGWSFVPYGSSQDCSFGEGPFSYIPFGPFPLMGIEGTFYVSVRVGDYYQKSKEAQRVIIKVNSLKGTWQMVDVFKGNYYIYPDDMMLKIDRKGLGYTGTWGSTPVNISYCSEGCLYLMSFDEGGLHYVYKVEKLTSSTMEGKWSWGHDPGNMQDWEPFYGFKISPSPLPHP